MATTINAASLALIKEFEGLRLKAYPDPATGGAPWTIGYGHTTAAGPPTVARGLTITEPEAEEYLVRDLQKYAKHVLSRVKVPLNANQFGALVSFTYNCGPGNLDKSTLLKKVNAKDFAGAANEFAKWNKAAGKVMKGLIRRRAAEKALFLTATASQTGAQAVPDAPPPEVPAAPETVVVSTPVGPPVVQVPTSPGGNGKFLAAILAILAALGAGLYKVFGG